jgi:hypothetical protein
VIGFEPVEEQCQLLKLLFPKDHTFLPYFIADGSERTFHVKSGLSPPPYKGESI